jgi:hypothetical protein
MRVRRTISNASWPIEAAEYAFSGNGLRTSMVRDDAEYTPVVDVVGGARVDGDGLR